MGIFEDLAEEFGIGMDSPAAQLAADLADADERFIAQLIGMRHAAGLTQEDLGRAWGRHKTAVSQFERPGADPRLSTIRRYAASIGARYMHWVVFDESARRLTRRDVWRELEQWVTTDVPGFRSETIIEGARETFEIPLRPWPQSHHYENA